MKNTNKQCKLYHNILFLKSILLLYSTKNVLNETKHFAQFHFQCSNKGFVLELSVAKFFFSRHGLPIAKEWEQKFRTGFTDQINLSTGVLFAEIWSRKMFSDRIFRNGLSALKTSAACAIPASDMVVLVFSQISLFAERTTN